MKKQLHELLASVVEVGELAYLDPVELGMLPQSLAARCREWFKTNATEVRWTVGLHNKLIRLVPSATRESFVVDLTNRKDWRNILSALVTLYDAGILVRPARVLLDEEVEQAAREVACTAHARWVSNEELELT